MNIEPVVEISGESDSRIKPDLLQKALIHFCSCTDLGSNVIVSLVICSSEAMKKINSKYRGNSSTTDVLSFPSENLNLFKEESHEEHYIGEILIDINYILEHKELYEYDDEITRIFIHGLLHLIGFDHLNTNQKLLMQKIEEQIIELIKQDGTSG